MKVGNYNKWLEALRSGKFEQGKNTLKYKSKETGRHSYCCWGVYGEVCKVSDKLRFGDDGVSRWYDNAYWGYPIEGTLRDFAEEIGVDNKVIRLLEEVNDSNENFTFRQIAVIIEDLVRNGFITIEPDDPEEEPQQSS